MPNALIITESISRLRNNLTVLRTTYKHDFDIDENEFQQKVEKIATNIQHLKESLKIQVHFIKSH